MDFYDWRPYVSAAERRMKAAREAQKLSKKGRALSPLQIDGRQIAYKFWGQSWCRNLERYSDFANRLPRGRTYARNGSVIDLQIKPGVIEALVSGSDLYTVSLKIRPVSKADWKAICEDCAGGIDSLVELLRGQLSDAVMKRICREKQGLFPSPHEIEIDCSCPDWAGLCKHAAAVLYGVGARFDTQPELLFCLRGVDEKELIARSSGATLTKKAARKDKVLETNNLAAMFGLDMAEAEETAAPPRKSAGRKTAAKKKATTKKKAAKRKKLD